MMGVLEHHIATVAEYIKKYNAIDSQDEGLRCNLFHTFTCYLIASCWRKMQRRVNHWSSLGFLHILGSLDKERVQKAFNPSLLRTTRRKDSALAKMLKEETLVRRLAK